MTIDKQSFIGREKRFENIIIMCFFYCEAHEEHIVHRSNWVLGTRDSAEQIRTVLYVAVVPGIIFREGTRGVYNKIVHLSENFRKLLGVLRKFI